MAPVPWTCFGGWSFWQIYNLRSVVFLHRFPPSHYSLEPSKETSMGPEVLNQVSGFTIFYFVARQNKVTRFRKRKSWKINLLFSIVFHVPVMKILALLWQGVSGQKACRICSVTWQLCSPSLKIWQRIRILFKLENVLWEAV